MSKCQIRWGRKVAQSSTSQESAEALCARNVAQTGRFLRGKLNYDHNMFSFYESEQGAANGEIVGAFFGDA